MKFVHYSITLTRVINFHHHHWNCSFGYAFRVLQFCAIFPLSIDSVALCNTENSVPFTCGVHGMHSREAGCTYAVINFSTHSKRDPKGKKPTTAAVYSMHFYGACFGSGIIKRAHKYRRFYSDLLHMTRRPFSAMLPGFITLRRNAASIHAFLKRMCVLAGIDK